MTEQGYRLGSTITPGCVESQTVLPNRMVPLAAFHIQVGAQAEFCDLIWPLSVVCDQAGL